MASVTRGSQHEAVFDDAHSPSNAGSAASGSDDDQTGSRKRKRPMNVTCEACKTRKVRCDRVQPSCGWCSRNDHICEYKERRKPGLRAGYGRELESRLERLEQQLHEQGQQLAFHLAGGYTGLHAPQSSGVAPSKVGQTSDITQSNSQHKPSSQVPHEYAPLDPTQHHSLSRNNSYTAEPPNAQSQNQYTPSAQSHALTSPIPTSGFIANDQPPALPPYDLLYTLVELFFKHINCWLPIIDRRTTLDRLFGSVPLDDADRVLLHALVAVALRFCKDPRLTPENKEHYHKTSKQRVQLFSLENSSVRSLQALTILALDVTGDTNGPPGWNIISLLSRSVVQLGLAVETTSTLTASAYPSISTLRAAVLPEASSWIEDEERRRLFWSAYLLDRYATIATAFDFALDDRDIDRRLPCHDELFAGNQPVETKMFQAPSRNKFTTGSPDIHGHFSALVEVLGILSSIHRFLKRPIDIGSLTDIEHWQATYRRLDSELNAWHFNLPDGFANITRLIKTKIPSRNTDCGWITVHAAYCLAVIRLNSSAAYPSQTSPLFSSSYSAMQRCLSAVDYVRELANLVQISGLLDKLGPPFAFCVWVCARVTLVHGSTMDHEIDPDLGAFVSILSEMGSNWDVSRRYAEILNRVLVEYQQSRTATNVTGERSTPSTVRILADMRRCAYDLDFLISRQPHHAVRSYHPTRANTPQPNELEYLDVFDLFNFPMHQAPAAVTSDLASMDATMLPNFAVPNPEEDWLFHPQ